MRCGARILTVSDGFRSVGKWLLLNAIGSFRLGSNLRSGMFSENWNLKILKEVGAGILMLFGNKMQRELGGWFTATQTP